MLFRFTALEADRNAVAVFDSHHEHVGSRRASKRAVAAWLVRLIESRLVDRWAGRARGAYKHRFVARRNGRAAASDRLQVLAREPLIASVLARRQASR